MRKRAALFFLILVASTSVILLVTAQYGEESTSLGQFVDEFTDLNNVSVIVDLVRNSTLDVIEVNGTDYTEYIQAPFQLREHKRYAGFEPNHYWTLGAGDLREYTSNAPRGDGWMFVNCDAQWLEGKYIRLRWFTVGSQINRPMYFRVYDGSYDRTSLTDWANDTAILEKGAGLLYEYREPNFNSWNTRDFEMELDVWSHTETTVMIAVYLWDGYEFYTRAYLDWIEWNDGAGGADNIFNITFSNVDMNEVQEQIGTYWDHGYINNTGLPLTGGGYDSGGYLTTTDYLDYVNGSTLALMTQTRIFPDTHVTVQFSDDNATWGDAEGVAGDSHDLLGGLETIELRPWNESSSVYVMYNLTATVSVTPYLNQSRLITTEGQAGAGPGAPGVNVSSEWTYFNASEIGVTTGTLDFGGLVNVSTVDGTRMNISEVVGVPGMDISFNFTAIPTDAGCVWLVINCLYDGSSTHEFCIDLWNHTGSAWETIGHIPDQLAFEWINSTIYDLRIPADYVNATGDVRGRLYHVDAGNINHDLSIEFLNIYAEVPSTVTPSVSGGEVDVSIFIALAIILSLIAYLLTRAER